jgi:hypothetical protein
VNPRVEAALRGLDARLQHVCRAEEARAARLLGPGGAGWEGVRSLLTTPLDALLYDEDRVPPPLVEDGPLRGVADALGLPPIAADLLLVLLAPHVDTRYRTVLGVIQDLATPGHVNERGLVAVLGRSPAGWSQLQALLAPASPLVVGGIISSPAADVPLARPWELARDLVACAVGVAPHGVVGGEWRGLDGPARAGASAGLWTVPADSDWGPALAERFGGECAGILSVRLPRANPGVALASAWRVGLAAGAVVALDLSAPRADELDELISLATQLSGLGGALVLVARPNVAPALPAIRANPPTWRTRVAHWRDAGVTDDALRARLAAAWRISRPQIQAIVAASPSLSEPDLVATASRQLDVAVPHGVRRVVRHGLDDLVLRDTTRAGLLRLLYFVRNRDRLADDTARERAWRLGHGPVVLFSGRSGTGKTLAAEAVAGALHRPLVVVDLSRLVSKYIGETEKHIDEVLGAAERAGCVLFFDEADALFAQRTEVASSNDRYANLEVGYLLQRIEQHDGVVILATNLRQSLDEAFLRRFQFRIEFPLPDEAERTELWTRLLAVAGVADPALDLPGLAAAHRLSGGDIRNASLKALLLSEEAGVPLTRAHLDAAVALELLEMGRLSRRPELDLDRGQVLARVVDALDARLREMFNQRFFKEIHLVHGAPTREALAGKRPAVAVSVYRVAGPRAGRGFRFGAILSAWSNRPEEEHELLGAIHDAVAATAVIEIEGGQSTLRLQESADFDLLHRFWSSHGQPVRASVVVDGETS